MDQMDIVRALFGSMNRGDIDAIVAAYHPACVLEHVFIGDDGVREGRDAVRVGWAEEFARYGGALPGGHRVAVQRVAGMETGWGWVRADWVADVIERESGRELRLAGYSHFWIEEGLIRRQRNIARPIVPDARPIEARVLDPAAASVTSEGGSSRRYPTRPLVGVGAVIFAEDGRVVLVKRKHEPLAGQWSLPGGMLELGETLEAGAAREVLEETGLVVDVGPVVEVFDRILMDETGQVRYHFVLIDYLCRPRGGSCLAGSDVSAVELADPRALDAYRVTEKVRAVVAGALAMKGHGTPPD
jgi:ADP-ribose pyrophosphatase YjhB (NUDIX family)